MPAHIAPLLLSFWIGISMPLVTLAGAANTWDFRVFLDDKEIGSHRFDVVAAGAARTLTSEARFDVKFLFVTAYEYDHKAVEGWDGDCLASLESRTDDNGSLQQVKATRTVNGTIVASRRGTETLAQCVMTFAYWNPAMLKQSRLLNSQNGEFVDLTITEVGEESIPVRGASVPARRFALRSRGTTAEPLAIDLWYAGDQWVGLESRVENGRRLIYRLK